VALSEVKNPEHGPLSLAAADRVRSSLASKPPKRVLAICREHIGDIVNTTGALRSLKKSFPEAELTAEVGERAVGVLEGSAFVDRVIVRSTHQGLIGKLRAILSARAAGFDLSVVLDDSNPHIVHAKFAGIPIRVGVWRERKYAGAFSCAVPYRTDWSETRDNFAALLDRIGAKVNDRCPELAVKDVHRRTIEQLLQEFGCNAKRMVGLQPGASQPVKRWSIDSFIHVAQWIVESGQVPVVMGGVSEHTLAQVIVQRVPGAKDATGRMTILELAAFADRLGALVTNDTGALHVVASRGTPCVALYGPTDPVAFAPWGDGHSLLRGTCDCPIRAERTCNMRCLSSISPHQVIAALESLI